MLCSKCRHAAVSPAFFFRGGSEPLTGSESASDDILSRPNARPDMKRRNVTDRPPLGGRLVQYSLASHILGHHVQYGTVGKRPRLSGQALVLSPGHVITKHGAKCGWQ